MAYICPKELAKLELKAKLWEICCECEAPSKCDPKNQWQIYEQRGDFGCETLNSIIFKNVTVNYLEFIPAGYHYEWAIIESSVYDECVGTGTPIQSDHCLKIGENLRKLMESYQDNKDVMCIRVLVEDSDEEKAKWKELEKDIRKGRKGKQKEE